MKWGVLIGALATLLAPPARGQETPEPDPCFDVAVVARLVRQTPEPFPDDPDVIVMRWPWILDFETEQVLIGRESRTRFQAMLPMHAEFRRDIEHFLLFLRRDPQWGYRVVDRSMDVVSDRRGRFVIPVERPIEREDLRPASWIPASYESYLRTIRYRAADAWWLNNRYVEQEDIDDIPPGWFEQRGNQIVAVRGLRLSDLSRMMANEPGAICEHAG